MTKQEINILIKSVNDIILNVDGFEADYFEDPIIDLESKVNAGVVS